MNRVCWGLLFCCFSANAYSTPIKIATWNLNWFTIHLPAPATFPADAPRRVPADIAALRRYADHLNADIVAFEEVDGAASAAALFPPEHFNIVTIRENVPQQVGLAVRRPIVVTQNADLTALDTEPSEAKLRLRYGLDATLALPGGATLRLLAVHLKTGCHSDPLQNSRRTQCSLLAAQLPPLAAWVRARAAEGTPFALLGDFNRVMDKPEEISTTLENAAPLLRVTEGHSDPCWSGGAFIDHIFLGGPARGWLVPGSLRVMIYHDNNDADKDRLSDHCAVSVRLHQ